MSKRNDKLKEKLNALKPSIPTNTRSKALKMKEDGQRVSPVKPKRQEAPAVSNKPESPPEIETTLRERKPEIPKTEPGEKTEVKGGAGGPLNAQSFSFAYAFILSDLMQDNLASLSRIREVMITEANTMSSMCMKSCWKSVAACYNTAFRTCGFYTQSPFGKWPFKM